MRTTTKPPRREKMVPFPARLDRRATLTLHTLEGIPDDMLRAVASHAPGERVRALAETGVVRYATGVLTPTPDERLEERVAALEKVVTRLSLEITGFLQDQAEQARRSSERTGFYDLTRPLNQATREKAFEEWEAESFARADQEV